MAIYHLAAKIISRKDGRSSTAAAAYRSGDLIVDHRTGQIHDYSRKRGIVASQIVMPAGTTWQPARADLWNAVELRNKRADSQVAREFVVALPCELSAADRQHLAVVFAQLIASKYSVAVDVAVHAPARDGDDRNHHAHLLVTTNRVVDGQLGNKARELDFIAHNYSGKVGQENEIDRLREYWATLVNAYLVKRNSSARVDHRSHAARGIEREPTQHLGPLLTGIRRRTGRQSLVGQRIIGEHASRLHRRRTASDVHARAHHEARAAAQEVAAASAKSEARTLTVAEKFAELRAGKTTFNSERIERMRARQRRGDIPTVDSGPSP